MPVKKIIDKNQQNDFSFQKSVYSDRKCIKMILLLRSGMQIRILYLFISCKLTHTLTYKTNAYNWLCLHFAIEFSLTKYLSHIP